MSRSDVPCLALPRAKFPGTCARLERIDDPTRRVTEGDQHQRDYSTCAARIISDRERRSLGIQGLTDIATPKQRRHTIRGHFHLVAYWSP